MINVELVGFDYIVDKKDYGELNQKKFGEKRKDGYFLNEYEVVLLLERKKIILKKKNKKVQINDIIKKKKFNLREYEVFKDMRSKGYVLKTGLKYGVVFRVYEKNSSKKHSLWLLDVVKEEEKISFRELSGKNRIANSTKKKYLIAIVDREMSITYIENNWKKV